MSDAGAMPSAFTFPTTGLGAFPTDGSFPTGGAALSGVAGLDNVSEFGCPLSAFVSLESVCSATAVPSCAAAAITGTADPFSITYDAACCTSLSQYGESVASCYSKHAPSCLDTTALLASATDDSLPASFTYSSYSDPCAQYFGGKSGGKATPAASAGSGSSGGAATVTGSQGGATGSATGESSTASAAAGSKPNAGSVNAVGLKVWIGVVAIGAVGVLAL